MISQVLSVMSKRLRKLSGVVSNVIRGVASNDLVTQ